jgi:plasmid maintenance system antidote protein VapI
MAPIDKNLFGYLTRDSGHNMDDVARIWNCSRSGVSARINGRAKLTRDMMEAWMRLVGVADAGPVFFPAFVAGTQQENSSPVSGVADG